MIEENGVSIIKQGAGGTREKMNVTNTKRNQFELNVFSYKDVENLVNFSTQILPFVLHKHSFYN